MKELMEKISSYNLFNYLLPGVLFSVLADNLTTYRFIQSDIVVGVFVYYFIGLIVSRIGSLVLEPILKKVGFIQFSPYEDYVAVSTKDAKLDVLSEVNNMYRSFSSLFLLLLLLKLYELYVHRITFLESNTPYILIGLLVIVFILSYGKQTKYIHDRVTAGKSEIS